MQRCPSCQSRLKDVNPQCPRCGADFSRTLQCGTLAKLWLSLAMQMLNAGEADIAVAALLRSLSFKQTQAARLFMDFFVQLQYQSLYHCLANQDFQHARLNLLRMQSLQGDNQTLDRFRELVDYLSAQQPSHL